MSETTPPHEPIGAGGRPADLVSARVLRLIRLIHLVQGGHARTVRQLARQLNVSRRTVFRDVRTLENAGVPIARRPGRGYAIDEGYSSTPLRLGVAESLGLMLMAKVARGMPDQPVLQAAIEAVDRLMDDLPEATRCVYADLLSRVSIATGRVSFSADDERHYHTLQYAIGERKICRAVYDAGPAGGRCTLHIHPLHLHFWRRSWYVLAFCEANGKVRPLKLSRFTELEATDRDFAPRPFNIDSHLDDAWGVIPEGRKYDVAIDFSPLVARNVADIAWHRTQETTFREDGSCQMRFHVNGLNEIKWWVLGYGDQAIVRKPAELRQAIADIARATAHHYAGG
jgi:predicted DNA-binding transcriptional regulator YafY